MKTFTISYELNIFSSWRVPKFQNGIAGLRTSQKFTPIQTKAKAKIKTMTKGRAKIKTMVSRKARASTRARFKESRRAGKDLVDVLGRRYWTFRTYKPNGQSKTRRYTERDDDDDEDH